MTTALVIQYLRILHDSRRTYFSCLTIDVINNVVVPLIPPHIWNNLLLDTTVYHAKHTHITKCGSLFFANNEVIVYHVGSNLPSELVTGHTVQPYYNFYQIIIDYLIANPSTIDDAEPSCNSIYNTILDTSYTPPNGVFNFLIKPRAGEGFWLLVLQHCKYTTVLLHVELTSTQCNVIKKIELDLSCANGDSYNGKFYIFGHKRGHNHALFLTAIDMQYNIDEYVQISHCMSNAGYSLSHNFCENKLEIHDYLNYKHEKICVDLGQFTIREQQTQLVRTIHKSKHYAYVLIPQGDDAILSTVIDNINIPIHTIRNIGCRNNTIISTHANIIFILSSTASELSIIKIH